MMIFSRAERYIEARTLIIGVLSINLLSLCIQWTALRDQPRDAEICYLEHPQVCFVSSRSADSHRGILTAVPTIVAPRDGTAGLCRGEAGP